MRSRGFWIVAFIALVIRLVYLAQIGGTPITDVLLIDAGTYDRFARRILAGTFQGEDVYAMNPLYPYFLAGLYALLAGATSSVLVVQAVLGALNAAMVFALGRRMFGGPTGWVAGLAAACYAPYVFFAGTLLTPTLVETCLLGALLALAAWRTDRRTMLLVAAGIGVGLAALGRGNAILFVVLAPAFFRLETQAWRRAWQPWLLFAAAALALPMLVTARNALVKGSLVPVSANYAAFYIGHFDKANGLYVSPELAASASFDDEVTGVRGALSRELGRPLTQAEASRELLARGVRWALAHPREELWLAARKTQLFWNGIEAHTNLSFYIARDYSGLLRALPLGLGIVAPLGLAGLLALRRRWREDALLYMAILVPFATCVVFFVSSEYRLPAVAPLLLFAAHAVVQSAAWLAAQLRPRAGEPKRRARPRQAAAPNARAVAVPVSAWVALAFTPILAWACNTTPRLLRDVLNNHVAYQNYAIVYAGRGQLEMAGDMVRRAMAADPVLGQVDRERAEAEALIDAGRDDEALAALQRVHARYLELSRPAEATDTANSIGFAFYRLGRLAEADSVLKEIVAKNPAFVSAQVNLGLVHEAEGRVPEAEAAYQRALALDPDEPRARGALERLTGAAKVPAASSR